MATPQSTLSSEVIYPKVSRHMPNGRHFSFISADHSRYNDRKCVFPSLEEKGGALNPASASIAVQTSALKNLGSFELRDSPPQERCALSRLTPQPPTVAKVPVKGRNDEGILLMKSQSQHRQERPRQLPLPPTNSSCFARTHVSFNRGPSDGGRPVQSSEESEPRPLGLITYEIRASPLSPQRSAARTGQDVAYEGIVRGASAVKVSNTSRLRGDVKCEEHLPLADSPLDDNKTAPRNADPSTKKNSSAPRLPNPGKVLRGYIESYMLQEPIQDCLYGSVYRAVGLYSGDDVAIKILAKQSITEKETDRELPETPLAEVFFAPYLCDHPNIAAIREVFEADEFHLVVSDLAEGEDLLELLKLHPQGMSEHVVKRFMREAAVAIAELHRRQIALQDFSLENCLLFVDRKTGAYRVKLCDPGQAVKFSKTPDGCEALSEYIGCVGKKFRPPEIFTKKPLLASKIDSWCLGWSTFYLLFAVEIITSAWPGDEDPKWLLFEKRHFRELFRQLGVYHKLSPEATSFILMLMEPNAQQRMSVAEALQHPFLNEGVPTSVFPSALGAPRKRSQRPRLEPVSGCIAWSLQFLFQMPDEIQFKSFEEALEKEKRARSTLAVAPIIPEIYFSRYAEQFCTRDKPSGSLLPFADVLRSVRAPARRSTPPLYPPAVSSAMEPFPEPSGEGTKNSSGQSLLEVSVGGPANGAQSLRKQTGPANGGGCSKRHEAMSMQAKLLRKGPDKNPENLAARGAPFYVNGNGHPSSPAASSAIAEHDTNLKASSAHSGSQPPEISTCPAALYRFERPLYPTSEMRREAAEVPKAETQACLKETHLGDASAAAAGSKAKVGRTVPATVPCGMETGCLFKIGGTFRGMYVAGKLSAELIPPQIGPMRHTMYASLAAVDDSCPPAMRQQVAGVHTPPKSQLPSFRAGTAHTGRFQDCVFLLEKQKHLISATNFHQGRWGSILRPRPLFHECERATLQLRANLSPLRQRPSQHIDASYSRSGAPPMNGSTFFREVFPIDNSCRARPAWVPDEAVTRAQRERPNLREVSPDADDSPGRRKKREKRGKRKTRSKSKRRPRLPIGTRNFPRDTLASLGFLPQNADCRVGMTVPLPANVLPVPGQSSAPAHVINSPSSLPLGIHGGQSTLICDAQGPGAQPSTGSHNASLAALAAIPWEAPRSNILASGPSLFHSYRWKHPGTRLLPHSVQDAPIAVHLFQQTLPAAQSQDRATQELQKYLHSPSPLLRDAFDRAQCYAAMHPERAKPDVALFTPPQHKLNWHTQACRPNAPSQGASVPPFFAAPGFSRPNAAVGNGSTRLNTPKPSHVSGPLFGAAFPAFSEMPSGKGLTPWHGLKNCDTVAL